jgi:hypothetical protein
MAEKKDRVGQMRENFESKYGSPTGSGKVLIGMKSGKAVYGDELDAVDTSGANVINNTYSQNQAIMDGMFKEMGRSGGMYTPSTPDIRRAEQLSPPTEADYKVTTRADGKKMVGAYSPEAAAMRESSSSDAQFLKTLSNLNSKPRTSATQEVPSVDITQASSTKAATSAPKSMTDALGGLAPTNIKPAFDIKGENAEYLKNMQSSGFGGGGGSDTPSSSSTSGNPMMDILNSGGDVSEDNQSTTLSNFNYLNSLRGKKKTPWYEQFGNKRPEGFGYPA